MHTSLGYNKGNKFNGKFPFPIEKISSEPSIPNKKTILEKESLEIYSIYSIYYLNVYGQEE